MLDVEADQILSIVVARRRRWEMPNVIVPCEGHRRIDMVIRNKMSLLVERIRSR